MPLTSAQALLAGVSNQVSPSNAVPTGDHEIFSKIAIVGLGFVGYKSALDFCRSDRSVVGVDTDQAVIDAIRNGTAPVESTGLEEYVEAGSCEVTADISKTSECDVYIVSVPTPLREDETPDPSYVREACQDIATVLDEGDLVVVQSTLYPGCTRDELIPGLERSGLTAGSDFGVSHVPERYSPGVEESRTNTRVVGSISDEWRERTVNLYETIVDSTSPVSSLEIAETTKLIENIQRDVNIALMNELSVATRELGIDIWEVIDGAATKWNFHRYEPGLGVGGHCIPVDPHYLRSVSNDNGVDLPVVQAARTVNDSMPEQYFQDLLTTIDSVGKSLSSVSVSVLGVTYKPRVKDIRNSPALQLIDILRDADVPVDVYDPEFEPAEEIGKTGISNSSSPIEAVRDTDVVIVATAHEPFQRYEPQSLTRVMERDPILIDPRRTFDRAAVGESPLILSADMDLDRSEQSWNTARAWTSTETGERGKSDD